MVNKSATTTEATGSTVIHAEELPSTLSLITSVFESNKLRLETQIHYFFVKFFVHFDKIDFYEKSF